jgi:hypothetical protein
MALLNGRPRRMLLEGEILAAQSISKSEAETAVKLGVSFMTYRKYAKMYGVYGRVSNRAGRGIDKSIKNEDSGKYPLNKILEGKFPNYSTGRLKVRMIRGKRIEEKCSKCGFEEHRISDNTVPLLLDYIDGNEKNKKRENLRLLCYNCYYLYVNNPFGCRKKFVVMTSVKDPPLGFIAPPGLVINEAGTTSGSNVP